MPPPSHTPEPEGDQVRRLQAGLHDAQQLALSAAFKHEELSLILDSISDGCIVVDRRWRVTYLNASAERFFQCSRDALVGQQLWDHVRELEQPILSEALRRAMDDSVQTETEWYDTATSTWWEARVFPTVRGLAVYLRDISERKHLMAQLAHQAFHDPLTGLPNRALLFDRIELALAHAGRRQHAVALFFVDLDDFKQVNDVFGHDVGDSLIVLVARRLEQVLRAEDTISRLGGDEFVVMLPAITRTRDAIEVARRIISVLSQPFEIDDHVVTVSASVGGMVAHSHQQRPHHLLREADAAMYIAKSRGKKGYYVVTDTVNGVSSAMLDRSDATEQGDKSESSV